MKANDWSTASAVSASLGLAKRPRSLRATTVALALLGGCLFSTQAMASTQKCIGNNVQIQVTTVTCLSHGYIYVGKGGYMAFMPMRKYYYTLCMEIPKTNFCILQL